MKLNYTILSFEADIKNMGFLHIIFLIEKKLINIYQRLYTVNLFIFL